jgi:hypothetical protein
MNFEFAEQINPFLQKLAFNDALAIAESSLSKIPLTDFHSVLGKTLLHHTDGLANWIESFYKSARRKIRVKALYFELIEFDINFSVWNIAGFAYDTDGGLDMDDMEWLSDFTNDTCTKQEFILTGYEKLQNAFENIDLASKDLQDARDWCEQIIIARFMELMRATHVKAKEKRFEWAKLPVYFTEHAYDDLIVRSTL